MASEAERIASGLSKAQREYILAHNGEEYHPRHGRTANWALNHGYAETLVRVADGPAVPWDTLTPSERAEGPLDIGGQILTPLGLQVRAILEEQSDD